MSPPRPHVPHGEMIAAAMLTPVVQAVIEQFAAEQDVPIETAYRYVNYALENPYNLGIDWIRSDTYADSAAGRAR